MGNIVIIPAQDGNRGSWKVMQLEELLEVALGVSTPWYVREAKFDLEARALTIRVDFRPGSQFTHPEVGGEHPAHDTLVKRYRHLP